MNWSDPSLKERVEHVDVFPGLSGPHHPDFEPVHDLLRDQANDFGLVITVAVHRGQTAGVAREELYLDSAIKAAVELLANIETQHKPFMKLAISFDYQVLLAAAQKRVSILAALAEGACLEHLYSH